MLRMRCQISRRLNDIATVIVLFLVLCIAGPRVMLQKTVVTTAKPPALMRPEDIDDLKRYMTLLKNNSITDNHNRNRRNTRLLTGADLISYECYAAFSCSQYTNSYDAAFYLPLTALVWERLGFKSIVILIGSRETWNRSKVHQHILHYLIQRRCELVYVENVKERSSILRDVSKLFSYRLTPLYDHAYLISSDLNIWPLQKRFFHPSPDTSVVSTNPFCCGAFTHNNLQYHTRSSSAVGTFVSNWKMMMEGENKTQPGVNLEHYNNDSLSKHYTVGASQTPPPPSERDMMGYFEAEFGSEVHKRDRKGHYKWDERMLSIRMDELARKHGIDRLYLVDREEDDRYYISDSSRSGIIGKIDFAVPRAGYLSPQWDEIITVLYQILGMRPFDIKWAREYRQGFLNLTNNLNY